MTVTVVDYGLGNMCSVLGALRHEGIEARIDVDGSRIPEASCVLVPGVAAFAAGLQRLRRTGQAQALDRYARTGNRLVGLCLGAQMLLEGSEEAPGVPGLGLVPGRCERLDPEQCTVPNPGWLRVADAPGRDGFGLDGQYLYFSHGYGMTVRGDAHANVVARHQGSSVLAVYTVGNIVGVQFHPERSAGPGLAFLRRVLAPDAKA